MLHVTQRIKNVIEFHFTSHKTIEVPLYITYTQLACRKSLPSSGAIEEYFNVNQTFSSPSSNIRPSIYADNCIILPNGTCSRNPPAFTWRDYSIILFFNDNFDGGDFIFSNDFHGKDVPVIIINYL